MISHILEVTEFFDKKFLYDFRVDTIQYEIFDRIINTNKWLRFEDWLQIYDKLNKICSTTELSEISNEKLQINNNIELEIEKVELQHYYRKVFGLEKNELASQCLRIHIRNIQISNLLEKIKDYEKKLLKTTIKKEKENLDLIESTELTDISDVKIEYVPLGTEASSYAPYKPSKFDDNICSTSRGQTEGEQYSPKPVNSSTESFQFEELEKKYAPQVLLTDDTLKVPKYKPSAIVKKSTKSSKHIEKQEAPAQGESRMRTRKKIAYEDISNYMKSDNINKRKRPEPNVEKAKLSLDLFGSDDSDKEQNEIGTISKENPLSLKNQPKTPKSIKDLLRKQFEEPKSKKHKIIEISSDTEQKSGKSEVCSNTKPPAWCSKEDIKKEKSDKIKTKPKSSSTSTKSSNSIHSKTASSTQIKPIKLTEEEQRRNREKDDKDIAMLERLTKTVKALNKPTKPVEMINLDHLAPTELISSFENFKPMLDKHFQNYRNQKTDLVKTPEDMHYLLIMNIISAESQHVLVTHLRNNYEKDHDFIPKFTDLYMNLMLPEWVLGIFMKEYGLSRADAIENMKLQELNISTEMNDL